MSSRGQLNAVPAARWPWIVGGVALLLVVVVAIWYATGRSAGEPDAAEPLPSGSGDSRADGCLGGVDPSEAVLVAQREAPLTGDGAAAFLATALRWQGQWDITRDEFEDIGPRIWAPALDSSWTDWEKLQDEEREAEYTDGWTSFQDSLYRVEEITPDSASVAMRVSFYDGDDLEDAYVVVLGAEVVDGHWRFAGLDDERHGEVTWEDLQADGVPYEGAC